MAMDPRKRQKKQERRRAKDKAKTKALAQQDPRQLAVRLERAAGAPILHCCTTDVLWDEGMSNVLVSRELASGNVAYVVFLIDMYCLGVKDVAFNVASRSRYDRQLFGKLFRDYRIVNLSPEAARKLIEGAVEYARDLGLSPHPDYRKTRVIFGDIDADACTEEFVYGKDGEPMYIAGPHDSPARRRQITNILTERCGPNGFHFVIPLAAQGAPTIGGRTLRLDHSSF